MSHSKNGGESEIGETNHSYSTVSRINTQLFYRVGKYRGCGKSMPTIAAITPLALGGGVIPEVTTGMSILLIGLYGAVSLLAMKLDSALALLSWGLAGVMLVLAILGVVPIEVYFLAIALSLLAIASTAAYIATHA